MPGARLGRAGLGPQRATGQRQARPMAGWPIWEQGCLQIALPFHWLCDKALRVYIQTGEHLVSHFCTPSTTRGNKGILSLQWLICVLVCLLGSLCMCESKSSLRV